jgi:uncharacterized protein involved in type VI secretion and phage assembly
VELPANTIDQPVVFYVTPGSETTTTTASATTTTVGGVTTTAVGNGSLKVTVHDHDGHSLSSRANVQLGTVNKSNQNNVVLFEYLALTTYSLIVTANYYETYTGTVTITGANTVTIHLTYNGHGPGGH